MTIQLPQAFADAERLEMGALHPQLLNLADHCYLILKGSAGVYASRSQQQQAAGQRRFLFDIGSNETLFTLPGTTNENSNQLLLIPHEDIIVLALPCSHLYSDFTALQTHATEWFVKLATFMQQQHPAAPADKLTFNHTLKLSVDSCLRNDSSQMGWLTLRRGSVQLFNNPALRITEHVDHLAIAPNTFFSTTEESECIAKSEAPTMPEDWHKALNHSGALLRQLLDDLDRRDLQQEQQRQQARDQHTRARIDRAVNEVRQALTGDNTMAGHSGSALLGVLSVIGEATGITFEMPPAWEQPGHQYLETICRASRVKHRRVRLQGNWWQTDSGTLLAYRRGNAEPVALVYDKRGRYLMSNAQGGSPIALTTVLAEQLEPTAHMFYRPLPETIKRPWQLIQFTLARHRREVLYVFATATLATLIGMLAPVAMGLVVDSAIPDANTRLLLDLGLALLAAAFGVALFQFAQGLVSIRIAMLADHNVQAAVLDRLLRLPVSFFKRFNTGDLLNRVMSVSQITQTLNGATLRSLLASLMAMLNLGLMFYYSAQLALFAIVLGFGIIGFTLSAGVFMRRYYRPLFARQGRLFGKVVELITAVSKIRIAAAEERAYAHWLSEHASQQALVVKTQRIQDHIGVFNLLLPSISTLLLFAFGAGALVPVDGTAPAISLGMFLAFNVALINFISGMSALSQTLVELQDLRVRGERMQPILDEDQEITATRLDPGPLSGQIGISGVEFRYIENGPRVLKDINIDIQPGQFIGLVGPSGSGKSTLIRLLLGFETLENGSILMDGQELAALDPIAVRRQIGVVLQTVQLNSGSIFDNITAHTNLGLNDAWAAAENAALADEIRAMPMGMHTIVSEGGSNLSGGQRQRLLIARALVTKPRILLMDEATSALDNRTQAHVSAALEKLRVTRIVIAHRLSTIENADCIYVLDQGRIVEQGNCAELMQQNGLFAHLASRQMA